MGTIQRTFETRDLFDLLRSAEGVHSLFARLGYSVDDPEPLPADALDMNPTDAVHVQRVYLLNESAYGHSLWLFEVDDTSSVRLRGLAYDLLQRPGTHTLLVTRDYTELIVAHPYFIGGGSSKS